MQSKNIVLFFMLIPMYLTVGLNNAIKAQIPLPRPEHPKPQFQRDRWLNLNGTWDFSIDFGASGLEKGWPENPSGLDKKIQVPFCPESRLSGIGYTDFMPAVWYHRTFAVPAEWKGSRVFLHFGAVDYDCRAWVNGKAVGRHYGGSTSFAFDVTPALVPGENHLVVCAFDDTRSGIQPLGKQSSNFIPRSYAIYTRTTGIWQTVWLEARPATHLASVRVVPDLDAGSFVLTPVIENLKRGMAFRATAISGGKPAGSVRSMSGSGVPVVLPLKNPRAWSPSDPFLYDLLFELQDGGRVVDVVHSYAGLRKFHIEGNRFFLNHKPIFLRMVLDQGFYPDGIWTAPSDAALKKDVELSLAAGFNSARLHQKVFEERFHYWADRLGYLTWGEFADWGFDYGKPQAVHNAQREWREAVMRDLNHPSIVAWTPFNETSRGATAYPEEHRRAVSETVALTRALDPTRPVNDASGYVHVETDIFTIHDYDQNPATFRARYASVAPDGRDVFVRFPAMSIPYDGQPYVVDEYGGTFWTDAYPAMPADTTTGRRYLDGVSLGNFNRPAWGKGKTAAQVLDLVEQLTRVLTDHPHISGFTYCQLTDVENEVNGVYTYDRKSKFDSARLKKIFGAPASVEQR